MHLSIKHTLIPLAFSLFPLCGQAGNAEEEVYAFGYSTNLNDTTLYLTSIQILPEAKLTSREGFLVDRYEYGNQLKAYLESTYTGRETCAIFFSRNRKKLEKKYVKVSKHLKKMKHTKLTILSNKDFHFRALSD